MRGLMDLEIQRWRHDVLVERIWELRDNASAYDAVYIALAEGLGATLLTGDAALARIPGVRCPVELVNA